MRYRQKMVTVADDKATSSGLRVSHAVRSIQVNQPDTDDETALIFNIS